MAVRRARSSFVYTFASADIVAYPTGLQAGLSVAEQTGGTSWFNQSTPYYGVENSATFKLTGGRKINRVSFREGNINNNTQMWFLVLEGRTGLQFDFYIVAGWRLVQATAGNGSVLSQNFSEANFIIGNLLSDNGYVIPTSPTYGDGNYYIGWVSSDSRTLGVKNGNIWVDSGTGGAVDYITVTASGNQYPDQKGLGGLIQFTEGQNTGNRMHIGFFNL